MALRRSDCNGQINREQLLIDLLTKERKERPLAKRKAKRKIPNATKEEAQIKFDYEDKTFLWNGENYVNIRTGIIAPTRAHQVLDEIRLKGEAE